MEFEQKNLIYVYKCLKFTILIKFTRALCLVYLMYSLYFHNLGLTVLVVTVLYSNIYTFARSPVPLGSSLQILLVSLLLPWQLCREVILLQGNG
jgi:hypothetical protein